mgnify:CR=1 FL=1
MSMSIKKSFWRHRLHEIIYEADTKTGKAFDITLLFLIIVSVILVALESVESFRLNYSDFLNISETQSATQVDMVKQVESRLTEVQKLVSENLLGSATKTAHTLGELQQRLTTIDEAQNNIEKLSSSVLSLQDILSNKQARGSFGEIQLNDIVVKALSPDAYSFQRTLSNGKRVD